MSNSPIADLVNALFDDHRRPDGQEYTNKEVCEALNGLMDQSHLSRLRRGKIADPGRESLLALCRFFRVPPSYFFPELRQDQEYMDAQVGDDIAVLRRSYDTEVEQKAEELLKMIQRRG